MARVRLLTAVVLAAVLSPSYCIKLRFQGEECLSYTFNQVTRLIQCHSNHVWYSS